MRIGSEAGYTAVPVEVALCPFAGRMQVGQDMEEGRLDDLVYTSDCRRSEAGRRVGFEGHTGSSAC